MLFMIWWNSLCAVLRTSSCSSRAQARRWEPNFASPLRIQGRAASQRRMVPFVCKIYATVSRLPESKGCVGWCLPLRGCRARCVWSIIDRNVCLPAVYGRHGAARAKILRSPSIYTLARQKLKRFHRGRTPVKKPICGPLNKYAARKRPSQRSTAKKSTPAHIYELCIQSCLCRTRTRKTSQLARARDHRQHHTK